MKTPCARIALCIAGILGLGQAAVAQIYPSKPIRVIVPFVAGGGVDILMRGYSLKLPASLGQPVVVENRPGASGMIAGEHVARSAPDGYTLLAGGSWLQVGSFVYKKVPYSPARDFTPIALLAETPLLIVAQANVPAKSLQELIAYARANPGKLTYGSPGVGHPFHLSMEMFNHRAQVNLLHVPYKGGQPAAQDFLAGRLDVLFWNLSSLVRDMDRTGKARVLATATDDRLPALPAVPTFRESGIQNFITAANVAIVAPAALPRQLATRIHNEILTASATPEVTKAYDSESFVKKIAGPDEYAAIVKNELATWEPVVRALKLELE